MELVIFVVLFALLGMLANKVGAYSREEYRPWDHSQTMLGAPAARAPRRHRG
jgi:hypothetical protein